MKITQGSRTDANGWQPEHPGSEALGRCNSLGSERRITRMLGNLIYELDGKSALGRDQHYLGEEDARGQPSTEVLFPLSARTSLQDTGGVRIVWSMGEAFREGVDFAGWARMKR